MSFHDPPPSFHDPLIKSEGMLDAGVKPDNDNNKFVLTFDALCQEHRVLHMIIA